MAADQRRKRLNGANSVGYSSWDQYRVKKKKLGLGSKQMDRTTKSHITLEWDGDGKKVVANREQVGISWRGLKPYRETIPRYHNILAGVASVPKDIFDLENLTDVLSYEVWQTQLSENERNHLMQFLPSEPDEQQCLQSLLAGENLHFGNPFLKWGAALCSRNLHPDTVIHQELYLKSHNEVYHSELFKYHDNLIKYFQEAKERCENAEDPEREITQMWREKTDLEKRIFGEDRFHDFQENVEATSESCSRVADDESCSSDNQNSVVMKGGEHKRRICEKSIVKNKSRNQPLTPNNAQNVGPRAKKEDKWLKPHNSSSDGFKYMSYIKVSKKQHELVKNMKQSGKSVQSQSLNRVLGNLDGFHVQPYEVFEEEEQKKLHQHWLNLVHRDLPKAYANRRERQSQIQNIIRSLEQEMKEKLTFSDENDANEEDTSENEMMQNERDAGLMACESILQDPEDSVSISLEDRSPQQIPSLDGTLNYMGKDSEGDRILSKSDNAPEDESHYSGNLNSADITVRQEIPVLSQGDAWEANDMPQSYYGSTTSLEYTTSSGLSLGHSQPQMIEELHARTVDHPGHQQPQMNEEQHARMVNLGTDLQMKDVFHRQPDNVSFGSYPNQDGNGLLQSLFKGQGMSSYHHEQKVTGLHFQSPNISMEDGPFPRHFLQQSHPQAHLQQSHPQAHLQQLHPQPLLQIEQGLRRQSQVQMQHNVPENIYSDGGSRYFIPRQEHLQQPPLTPASVQDSAANHILMSAPPMSHSHGGGLLTQNWFSGDHQQVNGAWAGSDGAGALTRGMGSGSNADQSLFTVLSHCNSLRSGTSYDSMRTTEQVISPRNYGMLGGVTTPRMSNALPQTANPLEYLGGREAAATAAGTSLMNDEMVWMSLPHQNSTLHDSMGKPFSRRWNQ